MPSDSKGGVPRQRADDELPDGEILEQGCHYARVLAQHGPNDRRVVRDHLKGEKETPGNRGQGTGGRSSEKTVTTEKERQRKTTKDNARPRETRVGTRVDTQHQEDKNEGAKGLKEERRGSDTTRHVVFVYIKLHFGGGRGTGGVHT